MLFYIQWIFGWKCDMDCGGMRLDSNLVSSKNLYLKRNSQEMFQL